MRSRGALQFKGMRDKISFGSRYRRGPASLLYLSMLSWLERPVSGRWRPGHCRAGIFTRRCEPVKALAGLEVAAKAARRDQPGIDRAKQLVLPIVIKQSIPKMYVLMDGVQITAGRRIRSARLFVGSTKTRLKKAHRWPLVVVCPGPS